MDSDIKYKEGFKFEKRKAIHIEKLFDICARNRWNDLVTELRECKIENGLRSIFDIYLWIDAIGRESIKSQQEHFDKISWDLIELIIRKLFEIDVIKLALIDSITPDEIKKCYEDGHPISQYKEMWNLFEKIPDSVSDQYKQFKYSEGKAREVTKAEIASIIWKKPEPSKQDLESVRTALGGIDKPRLVFPKDAKWVNVKFKYINDVEIEIYYKEESSGCFHYTGLDGFYKGSKKTNLWDGLLYIAQRGSIEIETLESISRDLPRQFIYRLNKALERALFKEEGQRPIISESIDSTKYYSPRFGVIDSLLS